MSTRVEQLTEELKANLKAAQDIAAQVEKEGRDFTDVERTDVMAKMQRATEVKQSLEQLKADDALRKSIADLGDGIGLAEKPQEKRTPSGLIVPDGKKSLGQHFVDSDAYKGLLASRPGGSFGEKMRVQSQPVGFKTLVTGASDTSAGAFVQTDWRGLQVGFDAFQRPLTLRDVVTQGTTTSDTIEYARVTAITNNAAPVAEATSSASPEADADGGPLIEATGGGYKPESGFTTVKATANVKTIAHWLPATKRALSDAAQIRTLIDNFLRYGLEEELEDQMVTGDGTGENFTGIANVSGTQSQAWDTDILTTLRKAKTKVRTVGRRMANAYVLNPADLETIDLLQDNEGRYYFGGPSGAGTAQPALWGIPVIESQGVPAGTGYVGDWRMAVLWDREQASISITDSHGDFFVRNLVAILAELRAAFGIFQPNAFVEVDLTA
jgi:HK97 family phage major capsid protein